MMTQIIEEKIWTYEDYLNLADDKTCEILGGRLSMMVPAPEFNHQLISARMQFLIMRFVEKKDLGYVVDAPTDVVLDELKLRESHKCNQLLRQDRRTSFNHIFDPRNQGDN